MEKTKWFREAGLGLFVHWGLYAIPAGEYGGKKIHKNCEWIMKQLQIPLEEYRKLSDNFNPVNFDADAYVKRAKAWGAKYLCVTAKHHDGFALFDTKVSDYSVMHTPYGKDIIRQFAEACRQNDMTFCVYYSQMQDWEHPHANGNTWDYNPAKQDFRRYFDEKCVPQVKELLTKYGKIGMIWFDTPYNMPKPLCEELAEVARSCQPDCLINGRIGYNLGDYRQMADNSIPLRTYPRAWEVPMTLNDTWGYSSHDNHWATPEKVIENLVQIRQKGGNLLINIGPDALGNIPQPSIDILDQVGAWLKIHGESIYGTSATPDFPYIVKWGGVTYNAERKTLYLHVRDFPEATRRVQLLGLENRVKRVTLLSTCEELKFAQALEVARNEERFAITLSDVTPDALDTVLAAELDGDIRVQTLD